MVDKMQSPGDTDRDLADREGDTQRQSNPCTNNRHALKHKQGAAGTGREREEELSKQTAHGQTGDSTERQTDK